MKAANYQPSFSNWQIELANAITDPRELLVELDLDSNLYQETLFAHKDFPLRVPRSYVARMEKGNSSDPLLLQVLPQAIELQQFPGYSCDPLQEKTKNPIPGLLHKYRDRVLLMPSSACAVHCRYCFRRHFPYEENNQGRAGWEAILTYLQEDTKINEVILSGGDPLTVKDSYLYELVKKLADIPHLKRLRIHTRIPIVLPSRINADFIKAITATRLKPVIIVHCNHANEINGEVKQALQQLAQHHVTLLNQAVLLKNVNNSVQALVDLSEALFAAGIMPYYLHLLDKVQGAAHFEVTEEDAKRLMQGVMAQLSGYLVPKLVREVPGAPAKMPINIL